MSEQKPWFSVMTPEDAGRPDSHWVRRGAASRGKVVALPIAWEGWVALITFIVLVLAAGLLIWSRLFAAGSVSLASAIFPTVVVEGAIIAGFIVLVRARSARLPASDQPPR